MSRPNCPLGSYATASIRGSNKCSADPGVAGIVVGSVIVAVPAGVQDAGEGFESGVGDLGEHGGLAAGLVPQDLQVEGLEQLGLQLRAGRHDVPGHRELGEQGRVGGLGSGRGQGG